MKEQAKAIIDKLSSNIKILDILSKLPKEITKICKGGS